MVWELLNLQLYKAEILISLVEKAKRDDNSFIYAAKIKRQLEKELVEAKVKTVPMGLLGADKAPIVLTVTGPNFDDVMLFAKSSC